MEQLIQLLKSLLADNITLRFKAQGYHWNVQGEGFPMWHKFFGKIYEDFDGATDTYAEWLRMLKSYSPYRISEFFDLATISEPVILGDAQAMLEDLYDAVEKHKEDLILAGRLANELGENGLMDFLAARQTATQKWCWMIGSSMEMEED
jgi:DNA-binding ferritin-like protein